ncbi:MAG TPA: D-Ala-D-Ala carboxypeptidase family metallohydrolase [Longimicrobiales bacterium]|nr:D-Ala-D-Ala carboxypeptidase family metallohydrolase [Longimicrobiales bacterium]
MRAILRVLGLLLVASSTAALVRTDTAPPPPGPRAPATVLTLDPSLAPARGKPSYHPGRDFRSPLTVKVGGEPMRMAVSAVTVLPGERLELEVPPGSTVIHSGGTAEEMGEGWFQWTAPQGPGIHALAVTGPAGTGGDEVRINLLVARPAHQVADGVLNGYRIGAYREKALRGDPAYLPPEGFVEVSPADHDVLVSPHFTLGEFLCKQEGDPRYVVLSSPLLLKLELILEAVNEAGIPARGLTVMSAFRTPFYNRAIGNTTDYSRHLWGDAADVFIDEDGDGRMDDLNGDGAHSLADAQVLAQVVERLAASGHPDYPVGGMGSYRPNGAHGGFVHVDARGQRARW